MKMTKSINMPLLFTVSLFDFFYLRNNQKEHIDVFIAGGGMYGILGHGNESSRSTPKRLERLVEIRHVSSFLCTRSCTQSGPLDLPSIRYKILEHWFRWEMALMKKLLMTSLDGS